MPHTVRDVIKQPLSPEEVRALGARLGGVRELIKPTQKKALEGLEEQALVAHLSANPGDLRRPLIDTGGLVTAGFSAAVRAALEREWAGG